MQSSLSVTDRASSLTRLADDDFDCVVIGGGIRGEPTPAAALPQRIVAFSEGSKLISGRPANPLSAAAFLGISPRVGAGAIKASLNTLRSIDGAITEETAQLASRVAALRKVSLDES